MNLVVLSSVTKGLGRVVAIGERKRQMQRNRLVDKDKGSTIRLARLAGPRKVAEIECNIGDGSAKGRTWASRDHCIHVVQRWGAGSERILGVSCSALRSKMNQSSKPDATRRRILKEKGRNEHRGTTIG